MLEDHARIVNCPSKARANDVILQPQNAEPIFSRNQ